MLNYLRSVERTLTFDLVGLKLQEQKLCSSAEETGWMNAARGGRGEAGGLGSMQYSHNTPVDYKVGSFPLCPEKPLTLSRSLLVTPSLYVTGALLGVHGVRGGGEPS